MNLADISILLVIFVQVVEVFWRSTPIYYAWRLDSTIVLYIMIVVHMLAWLQMLCSLFHLDHLELFGIKQVCISDHVCTHMHGYSNAYT